MQILGFQLRTPFSFLKYINEDLFHIIFINMYFKRQNWAKWIDLTWSSSCSQTVSSSIYQLNMISHSGLPDHTLMPVALPLPKQLLASHHHWLVAAWRFSLHFCEIYLIKNKSGEIENWMIVKRGTTYIVSFLTLDKILVTKIYNKKEHFRSFLIFKRVI